MNEETKEVEDKKVQTDFLSAINVVAEKYGVEPFKDVNIDFENIVVNIGTEINYYNMLHFIAELEKVTGHLKRNN